MIPKDSTSSRKDVPDYEKECKQKFTSMTIGIPIEFLDGLDDTVKEVFEEKY